MVLNTLWDFKIPRVFQLQADQVRNLKGGSVASILLSGPAGGAKSQAAVELIKNGAQGRQSAADFQSIVVALLATDVETRNRALPR